MADAPPDSSRERALREAFEEVLKERHEEVKRHTKISDQMFRDAYDGDPRATAIVLALMGVYVERMSADLDWNYDNIVGKEGMLKEVEGTAWRTRKRLVALLADNGRLAILENRVERIERSLTNVQEDLTGLNEKVDKILDVLDKKHPGLAGWLPFWRRSRKTKGEASGRASVSSPAAKGLRAESSSVKGLRAESSPAAKVLRAEGRPGPSSGA